MTSARKLAANRANARVSTGPRTAQGKERAARNARRHGLSLSAMANPFLVKQAEELAKAIAAGSSDPDVIASARQFAEAQVDLIRIREAKNELLAQQGSPSLEEPNSCTSRLLALDRYERRALSKRKFAIRDLDLARWAAADRTSSN